MTVVSSRTIGGAPDATAARTAPALASVSAPAVALASASILAPIVALAAVLAAALGFGATPAEAMSRYTWSSRPLVVFAGRADDAALAEQRRIVAASRAGFIERQVVVIYVAGDTVRAELGPPPGMSAAALRRRFGVGRGETRVLLVGKDGGVKLRSATALPAGRLFGTIDAMPMRADEMRRR